MIFLVHSDTIIAVFKRARTVLAIEDLRFSDSRLSSVSALAEIADLGMYPKSELT